MSNNSPKETSNSSTSPLSDANTNNINNNATQNAATQAKESTRNVDTKREQEFTTIFMKDLPPDEKLIEDYSCALQEKILAQGRMYISGNYVCFHSNLFGITTLLISFKDITAIHKRTTAIVFPNAIEIVSNLDGKEQKLLFTSFLFRDQAYQSLLTVWEAHSNRESVTEDELLNRISSAKHGNTTVLSVLSEDSQVESRMDASASDSDRSVKNNQAEVKKKGRFEFSSFDESLTMKNTNEPPPSPNRTSRSRSFEYTNASGEKEDVKDEPGAPTQASTTTIGSESPKAGKSEIASKDIEKPKPPASPDISMAPTVWPPVSSKCTHFEDIEEKDFYLNETFPLPLKEFFSMFFSDKSDFWLSVHNAMSYTDNTFTPWLLSDCCSHRQLSFISPINAKIGPKSTRVIQTQHCYFKVADKHIVIEAKSLSKDVPYGDCFGIISRLHIKEAGEKSTTLQVMSTVKFYKTVWGPKSLIERSCIDGVKEFYAKWLAMARDRIKVKEPAQPEPSVAKKERKEKRSGRSKLKDGTVELALAPSTAPSTSATVTETTTGTELESSRDDIANMSKDRILWFLAFVVFILVIPFLLFLTSRLSGLEQELNMYKASNNQLEQKVVFLRAFMELISEDMSGVSGGMKEQLDYWKTRPDLADTRLLEWKKQLESLNQQISESQQFLKKVESIQDLLNAPNLSPNSHGNVAQESSWGFSLFWILLGTIILATGGVILFTTESWKSLLP